MGNLSTTPQQEVKTETQDGQTVIIVQPSNPQVVYVPVYNTQVVYTTPPPPPEESNDAAAAAIMGFMVGIVIGAAVSDPYPYGWNAWGVGWHSHSVVVIGGPWRVPPRGRYPYTRPVPRGGYRAPVNINAPSRNVNVNVDRSNNVGRTRRPTTSTAARPATQSAPTAAPGTRGLRGATPTAGASATRARTGTKSSALSGYQNRRSTNAASARGRSSVSRGRGRR
jgi:hypothetical protein